MRKTVRMLEAGLLQAHGEESCREEHRIRIAYDAYRSVLTVFPMRGSIHSGLQSWATRLAILITAAWPPEISKQCSVETGLDITYREAGKYQGSRKEPDICIGWKNAKGDFDSNTVVEIGVSQTIENLHNVRDLHLMGGRHIHRVILVHVEEVPKFDGARLMNIDFKRWEESLREDSLLDDYKIDSFEGPLCCQDILCVGAINVFWEVWERDLKTG